MPAVAAEEADPHVPLALLQRPEAVVLALPRAARRT
jgi:hypothetical protein